MGRWSRQKRQACGPLTTSCSLFCDTKNVPRSVLCAAFSPVRHSRRRNPVYQLWIAQIESIPDLTSGGGSLMQQLLDPRLHLPFLSLDHTSRWLLYGSKNQKRKSNGMLRPPAAVSKYNYSVSGTLKWSAYRNHLHWLNSTWINGVSSAEGWKYTCSYSNTRKIYCRCMFHTRLFFCICMVTKLFTKLFDHARNRVKKNSLVLHSWLLQPLCAIMPLAAGFGK